MSQIFAIPINDQATHKGGGCNGSMVGENGSPMYSLTARDHQNGDGKTVCTLTGDHNSRVTDYTCLISEPTVMATGQGGAETALGICTTLNCDHEQPIVFGRAYNGYCVRRLTPLECERLQGYPDGWTDIPSPYISARGKRKKVSDAARYKALGNSISIPNWKWVLKRLSAMFCRDATLGSLFDVIGGFPYIWEQINGRGSARWASEIEDFPSAVTRLHFPD